MNKAMTEWQEAARRADEMRSRIADFTAAQLPVPGDLVTELAMLEDDVLTKLRAMYRSGGQDEALH